MPSLPWAAVALGAGVLVAALVWLWAAASGAFDISRPELERRYRLPGSAFFRIGSTDYYYLVQGRGPALIMIPPPYLSLRAYDALADDLSRTYTVVRFDLPANGLTRMAAERGYSVDTIADDLAVLMTHLRLGRAAVLGSSSGALAAYHFAARHPDRVTRLILISPSGMPRTAVTNPNRPRGSRLRQWFEHRYRWKGFWREALNSQFTSGAQPPEGLIQTAYDMNRLQHRTREYYAQRAGYVVGRPDEVLSRVRSPTLILWGGANTIFSPLEAEVAELWLVNAPSMIIKYPKLGLYPWLEAPLPVERDVKAFLAGRLDDRLRVTARLPVAGVTSPRCAINPSPPRLAVTAPSIPEPPCR